MNSVSGEVDLVYDRLSRSQKVTKTSVHSRGLLFQLDVFSEQLWPEALSGGQMPPCELTLGFTHVAQWLDSGLLHPMLRPWGLCPASCPGQLCGSNRMNAGTCGFVVKNLV